VDYNIAVHHIKHTADYGQAVEILKKNLVCIYSNMKSYRMESKEEEGGEGG
jgi:hypothetical protein